jgi:hypothetical protein
MTSTYRRGTLGSVASLLASTLYQGNPDRNHKLWNIISIERYKLICRCCWNVATSPLLVDLFLYSYKADLIQGLLKKNEKKLARSFNFTFCYIDDVLFTK